MSVEWSDSVRPAEPGEHAPAGAAGHPVRDVETRLLDPRVISSNRTVNALTGAVCSLLHLLGAAALWLTSGGILSVVLALAWVPVTAFLVWLALAWPVVAYRHWRYRIDAGGLEIWSGVVWRARVSVPRSRVQHIDVSQGPIERSYGIATLSLYTAGTEHSKVDLPGLDHAVALAIRDGLLPRDVESVV